MQALIRRLPLLATALVVVSVVGCSDGTAPTTAFDTSGETLDDDFTVGGELQNRTGGPLPEGARVLVLWGVSSSSPDRSVVFGEGTLADDGESYEIDLSSPPPAAALNTGGLGVGFIIVVTDQTLGPGDEFEARHEASVVGIAPRHVVIYKETDQAAAFRAWASGFDTGFTVGHSQLGGPGEFDFFVPADEDDADVIVDDLDRIEIVLNWT